MDKKTFNFCGILFLVGKQERSGFAVERIRRVGIEKKLWEKNIENIDQIWSGYEENNDGEDCVY